MYEFAPHFERKASPLMDWIKSFKWTYKEEDGFETITKTISNALIGPSLIEKGRYVCAPDASNLILGEMLFQQRENNRRNVMENASL